MVIKYLAQKNEIDVAVNSNFTVQPCDLGTTVDEWKLDKKRRDLGGVRQTGGALNSYKYHTGLEIIKMRL